MIPFAPSCSRREPCFPDVLIGVIACAFVILVVALSNRVHGGDLSVERQAVVRVGMASGVCVSPDGYILTAAHVVVRQKQDGLLPPGQPRFSPVSTIAVQFPGCEPQEAKVLRVAAENEGTDLAVLQVQGHDLPCLPLAHASPDSGADVVSMGYPSGHFARLESKVVRVGRNKEGLDMIQTSHRANSGHSGGPLLNADGEVIGICSRGSVDVATPMGIQHTEHYTLWARTESIYQLIQAAGLKIEARVDVVTDDLNRPELQVWGTDACRWCKVFKDDRDKGKIIIDGVPLDEAFVVTLHNPEKEQQQAQALGIVDVPVFVTEDGAKLKGYNSPLGLVKFLSNYQRQLVPPPPVAKPAAPPSEPSDSVPESAETPPVDDSQGAGLKAVVLVRKQELNFWQTAGVTLLERQAKGLIKSYLSETLGKYAEIDVVFERLTPARFNDLAAMAGMGESKKVAILVAVRQSYTGAGESILSYVEERLKKLAKADWQSATIEVVFERVDQEGYDALCAAIDRKESDLLSQEVPGGWMTCLMTSFGTLTAGIWTGTRRLLWRG